MYSVEEKAKIIKMFKIYSIKEISKITGISLSTIYKWKNKYEDEKQASKLIKDYILKEEYDKAIEIGEKFKNNEIIQSQMITIYIKMKEYDKAVEIGNRFPNNEIIQSQMITIYTKMKESSNDIQFKDDKSLSNKRTLNSNELNTIRSKILLNTITINDIELLNNIKDEIDENTYLLVITAIYERLNLKKKCISILKMINDYDNKKINKLIQEVKSKKKYYNIKKWDSIIGWPIYNVDIYLEEKQKEENITIQTKKEINKIIQTEKEFESINLPAKDSKKEIKKVNIISGSLSKTKFKKINNKSIEIKQEKNEPTIYETLSNQYKQMVYCLKLQYYREMYDPKTRKDATFKYDRLEEILLSKSSNKNAFRQLLLMLVGAGYNGIIENDYEEEYQIISDQINRKKQEIKVLTKKG